MLKKNCALLFLEDAEPFFFTWAFRHALGWIFKNKYYCIYLFLTYKQWTSWLKCQYLNKMSHPTAKNCRIRQKVGNTRQYRAAPYCDKCLGDFLAIARSAAGKKWYSTEFSEIKNPC